MLQVTGPESPERPDRISYVNKKGNECLINWDTLHGYNILNIFTTYRATNFYLVHNEYQFVRLKSKFKRHSSNPQASSEPISLVNIQCYRNNYKHAVRAWLVLVVLWQKWINLTNFVGFNKNRCWNRSL